MKVLLDTCAFLWLVNEDLNRLSYEMTFVFLDEMNEIYFSLISAWEICIKVSIVKLELNQLVDFFLQEQIELNSLSILPIRFDPITKVSDLPFIHNDPFDRLLISQAIVENIHILTADRVFKRYDVKLC